MSHHRGSWPVRRQLQYAGPFQSLPPVFQPALKHFALQPFSLPHCVIRILDLQLRQRRLTPLAIRLIQRRHLPDQHAHAPSVAHDVMHAYQEHMFFFRQQQQMPSH